MRILKFKITNIVRQRCINGDITITAACTTDNTVVKITIPSSISDRDVIREKLIAEYDRVKKPIVQDIFNVGDII